MNTGNIHEPTTKETRTITTPCRLRYAAAWVCECQRAYAFGGTKNRDPIATQAREIVVHHLRKRGYGFDDIAAHVGMSSHASAMAALERAERRLVEDPEFGFRLERAGLLADMWSEAGVRNMPEVKKHIRKCWGWLG